MEVDPIARNRDVWAQVNAQFTDVDAERRWNATDLTWGLFRLPESGLGLLGGGDLARLDVVELGAGTAYVSAWLARQGARPVAVDLSPAQLATAARCQARWGPRFPLVEADGERVPLRDGCADLVLSEYGAGPWCDPERWIPEAARLLRPGGRLVLLTNSPLAAMCVPEDAGPAGDRLLRGRADVRRVTWPGGGVEHHPAHGDWIRILGAAGFVVDALHELAPPEGSGDPDWYEIVTADWAGRWPAEDVWVAHLG
ncbi:class I SAM-dependent methyltransferase [Dermatobacter hominis]|uniref:class I SAM-dependent methyltransferase n=1 Tax=Dermatobacter hominis TaxID=2884263 RepID=UPI001D12DA63|nr:class I SAM-dependent methyltransferase [Dermatobacter hominis]UDY34312.1 class I SAM-dependent methyltransferase [Dermatobacter hominis]